MHNLYIVANGGGRVVLCSHVLLATCTEAVEHACINGFVCLGGSIAIGRTEIDHLVPIHGKIDEMVGDQLLDEHGIGGIKVVNRRIASG